MYKFILLFFCLCSPCFGTDSKTSDHVLGLTTQDKNGLHILMLIETKEYVRSSVRTFSETSHGKSVISEFPRDVFDELWNESKKFDLSQFAVSESTKDVEPSKNYVLTIQSTGKAIDSTYLIPKCDIKPELMSFINRLSHNLLPAGSPGLFQPCPNGIASEL